MASPLPGYYNEERPWGSFERFTENEESTVKILHVLPGKRLSLQRHKGRSEFWRVLSGNGTVTVGDAEHEAKAGDEYLLEIGTLHRLTGGEGGLTVLEIAFGKFDENDIARIEDDFNRT